MLTAKSQFEIKFDQDVYIARVRGLYPELMLNAGYNGVQTVDILTGRILRSIPFPKSAPELLTNAWLVSPDGLHSYLFDREACEFGIQVDHSTGTSSSIKLPDNFELPTGLCWFAPELYMRDHHGHNWVLRDSSMQEAPDAIVPDPIRTRLRLNDRNAVLGVLRLSYHYRGLYAANSYEMGFVSLADQFSRFMPQSGKIIDLALWTDGLLACREFDVMFWRNGEQEAFTSAPSGERFLSIETFAAAGKEYLLLLSGREDSRGSILRCFVSS